MKSFIKYIANEARGAQLPGGDISRTPHLDDDGRPDEEDGYRPPTKKADLTKGRSKADIIKRLKAKGVSASFKGKNLIVPIGHAMTAFYIVTDIGDVFLNSGNYTSYLRPHIQEK